MAGLLVAEHVPLFLALLVLQGQQCSLSGIKSEECRWYHVFLYVDIIYYQYHILPIYNVVIHIINILLIYNIIYPMKVLYPMKRQGPGIKELCSAFSLA